MATYQCAYADTESECVDTCQDETFVSCANGHVLRDSNTCVRSDACPCMLPDGTVLGVRMCDLLIGSIKI